MIDIFIIIRCFCRARISYHEALSNELYEEGFENSAYLLLQIINYENLIIDSIPSMKLLKDSKNELDYLFTTLKKAENYNKSGNFH